MSIKQLLAADYIGLTRRVLGIKITTLETTLIHVSKKYVHLIITVVFTSLKLFSRFTEVVFPLH